VDAFRYYSESSNIKFHRTPSEEELSFQFQMNPEDEVHRRIDEFENYREDAYEKKDLNKKIELIEKTITSFENAKKWFYRTKGGTIYFQEYYEHLHNSSNPDLSYIDAVKGQLNYCIKQRDYIIISILEAMSAQNGILKKDIYLYLPDVKNRMCRKLYENWKATKKLSA